MSEILPRLTAALADRYRIERELGAGGMATVYLAEDLKHHRKVAVKVLRPEIAASLGSERFFREIEIAARLQHPHILPLLDSGEGGGFFYFVMPYVAGESLRDRLAREGELPIHDAVKILAEVVDALAAAHAEGVVHRDIKPDNVMLSGRHALVTDFGVAKAVSEATGRQKLTTAGIALGTPSYMAPEQATADPQLDHRVDIYAAGVLGYEMLTGNPPFTGRSAQEILAAQVTQGPQPVSARRPAVPPLLNSVIMQCLEKRPADRWQKAEDLLAQLEVLATPTAGLTPTHTPPLAAAGAPRQFPRRAAWLAGGALVAAGALALTLRQRAPETIVLGKRTAVAVEPVFERWPSLSPDGRVIAYTRGDAIHSEVVVQQVEGGAPTVVAASLPGGGLPAISPDGGRMLFTGNDGLYLMATLGGQARQVATGLALFAAWSPDGSRFAYTGGTQLDTIYAQSVDQAGRTIVAAGSLVHSPAWSPDGEWIAYVEGNPTFHLYGNTAPSTIKLVRVLGGTPVVLTDSTSLNTSPIWLPGRHTLLFISNREGGRDIYQLALNGSGRPRGAPIRITTGLNPERLSLSADGRRLAYSVMTQTSNVWSIAIPARDSVPFSQARQVTSGTQNIEWAVVSPDGKWLYYDSDRSGNFDIWRLPLAGGPPEQLTTDPADDFAPTVSPDGLEVAFHSVRNGVNNREIFVMPAGGGPAVQVSTGPGDDRLPRWSPDGRWLDWTDPVSDSGIVVAERTPAGGWSTPRRYLGHTDGPWAPDGRVPLADSVGLYLLDPKSGQRTRMLPAGDGSIVTFGEPVFSPDMRTVYAPSVDATGRFVIRAFPVGRDWRPRTLVYADNPLAQEYRFGLALNHGRFYVPVLEPKLDVWVAEIEKP